MPNRQFSELYDLILPYVPAVETPLVDYHIRRVTREFCRRTTLWRHRVTINTQPGVNDYLLSPYDATEGTIGGGGGGGGWVTPDQQVGSVVTLFNANTNGSGSITLAPNGFLVFSSSYQYQLEEAAIDFGITIEPGLPARLVPDSFYESSQFGITQVSNFVLNGASSVANSAPLETELTGEVSREVQLSWLPNPVTLGETTPISEILFTQGYSNETPTYAQGVFRLEVFVDAPAADPEICDPYSIISVTCAGRPIRPLPEDYRAPYGARPSNGRPGAWYSPSARVVHLYPTPDAAYEVVVDVVCALTMTPTNPVMPEFLFVDYREIIADGVIASLKVLGNKPWYDPEGATLYARRYATATQGIRAKLRDANQPNVSTARGPRFGR